MDQREICDPEQSSIVHYDKSFVHSFFYSPPAAASLRGEEAIAADIERENMILPPHCFSFINIRCLFAHLQELEIAFAFHEP